MNHNTRFLQLVEQLRPEIKTATVEQVLENLGENHNLLLIDVREASEWAMGHIPNAIHLSKGVIERDIEKKVSDVNTPMVLYCGGGFRSTLAAYNLKQMGYTHVISMDGGFTEWLKRDYPVE